MTMRQRPCGTEPDEAYSQAELSWLSAFGMAVRLERVRLGWSQTELAERSGTGQPTVSSAERGFQVSMVIYRRLVDALGLSLTEIMEHAENLLASAMPQQQEMELPTDTSAALDLLVTAATEGTVTYLTRDGRRTAAVVPADLAESLTPESAAGENHALVLSAEESQRRLGSCPASRA